MKENFQVTKVVMAGLISGVIVGFLIAKETGSFMRNKLGGHVRSLGDLFQVPMFKGINKLNEVKKEILATMGLTSTSAEALPDDLEHA